MPEEDLPSPEEKLLRVIRSGGKPEESGAVASRPESSVTDAPVEETRPALKLKSSESAPASSSPSPSVALAAAQKDALPVIDPAPESPDALAPEEGTGKESVPLEPVALPAPSRVTARATGGVNQWLKSISRGLVAASIILISLAVWDAWGHFTTRFEAVSVVPDGGVTNEMSPLPATDPVSVEGLPSLDETLQRFRQRPLFALAAAVDQRRPAPQPGPTRVDWERYASSNLKLLGLSVVDADAGLVEAIVADAGAGSLHYLKSGEQLHLEGVRVTVESVERDFLVLTDGSRRVEIK